MSFRDLKSVNPIDFEIWVTFVEEKKTLEFDQVL